MNLNKIYVKVINIAVAFITLSTILLAFNAGSLSKVIKAIASPQAEAHTSEQVSIVIPDNTIKITTQPTNQIVCAGNEATFSVEATSEAGPLSYEWQQLCAPPADAQWMTFTAADNGLRSNLVRGIYAENGIIF